MKVEGSASDNPHFQRQSLTLAPPQRDVKTRQLKKEPTHFCLVFLLEDFFVASSPNPSPPSPHPYSRQREGKYQLKCLEAEPGNKQEGEGARGTLSHHMSTTATPEFPSIILPPRSANTFWCLITCNHMQHTW